MLKDLRFAFRTLLKSPGFTLMAAIALALGIGANTAIFSVVNAVLLQSMPFEKPERLVMIWEQSPRTGEPNVINPTNFLTWRKRSQSFERMAAFGEFDVSITGNGEPEVIRCMAVSHGYFEILGVQPILGRWFTANEDLPNSPPVTILSESLWRRRYGSDPGILGKRIQINGRDVAIVGVMPATFRFPQANPEVWQPLGLDPARAYSGRGLSSVARLKNGVTMATAQAEMNIIAAQLQRERPEFDSKWGITLVSLRQQAVGDVKTPLLVLLGAVGLVLLIACANVANLMLIRASGRSREMAIRAALGASARRIARQLLVESTLLAAFGGSLGLLLGIEMMNLLVIALPDTIHYANLKEINLDAAVFVFAAAISLATGILFGLAPAVKAARVDVQESLRGGRSVAGSRSLTRQALVVAEVALAFMLLIGAGLLIRSFSRLANVNPGFDARHVLSMQLSAGGRFPRDEQLVQFQQDVLASVRGLPGVEAAGMSHFIPLGRIIPATSFWRADQPRPKHGEEPVSDVLVVMPGFFAALNIPLVRGRVFDNNDGPKQPHAVVINRALANQFYPDEDPIGKVLAISWGKEPYHIIGVVGDVHQRSLDKDVRAEAFLCNLQEPTRPVYLVARTHGDPRAMAKAIQGAVRTVAPDLPISDVKTMDEYVSSQVAAPRFNTIFLGGFAALALLLAAVGIFGVISYSVAQRRQEIGIRRALGARAGTVMKLVIGQGVTLAAIGIGMGLAGAFAMTRLLESLLFGVTATDPLTFVTVVIVLGAVALAASFLPAWRASRVDPAEALRYE